MGREKDGEEIRVDWSVWMMEGNKKEKRRKKNR